MKKRGTAGTLIEILLMLLVLVVVIGFFGDSILSLGRGFFNLFGVGEAHASEKPAAKQSSIAEQAFNSFVGYYEACKKFSPGTCLCDQFDISLVPEGYSIKLESLQNSKTRIELFGSKPTPEKAKVVDNDALCFYQYDKSNGKFYRVSTNQIFLDIKNNYEYKINNKVRLFKIKNDACFVSGTSAAKSFNEITQIEKECSLKLISKVEVTGMLDLNDYIADYPEFYTKPKEEQASLIIEDINTFLSSNIGTVSRITAAIGEKQSRLERRGRMFNEAYKNFDKNNDGYINDDVYFISIRGLLLTSKSTKFGDKDQIRIHYLQNSEESRKLVEQIKLKLEELNGKLIFNDKELGRAEADEKYRFDFTVIIEENSKSNQGPVFLACLKDYENFIACPESDLIPAVFIDAVEVDGNGHYIFEGHTKSIARKIYEGVKAYIG